MAERASMERRTALRVIGAATLAPAMGSIRALAQAAPHLHHVSVAAQASSSARHELQFFTPAENELVDQLSEMIIPADDHSPGAHAAQVSYFADLMVSTSAEPVRRQWRSGLRQMHEEAARSSLEAALAKAAQNEGAPASELERFFAVLKEMTVNGYYTSAIGIHDDLKYQGNTYVAEFPGCTHSEHQGVKPE